MLGLTWQDWLVVCVYFAVIMAVGTWAYRRVKSSTSFFISDRRFGKLFMVLFAFGTGTHSDQAVGVASKTYTAGASGIWYQWLWLFVTPFYWIIPPLFRRMRAVTTSDYFEARYDRSVAVLFAVVGIFIMMVNIGVMLKGAGAMITAVSGDTIPIAWAIGAMTAMFVLYGIAGGLAAAIMTDFIQGMLTIVLSFLILPFALAAVSGMSGLREAIADPTMFEIVAPGEITAFYVAVIAINGLVGWATQPHSMGICAAGKTDMEGRVGVMVGNFVKRVCTIAWMLTGLAAVAIFADEVIEPDKAYGLMAGRLLPQVAPGLVGLFIASLLAAVMSSCDAFMVTSSALFTENIYRSLLVKDKSDKHYVLVGRAVSAIVVVCAIIIAFKLESVVKGLELFWKISAMMGIAFWVGLFWRRATVVGAWAATLAGFAAWAFTTKIPFVWDFNARFAQVLPEWMLWEGNLWLPMQMIFYLAAGFIAMVVVSLLTRRVAAKKLDRFYGCIRTPVGPNEPETVPFTLPEGVAPAPRRVLIDHPDFEIARPTLVSVVGFLAAWVVVGLLIAAVYWIFS